MTADELIDETKRMDPTELAKVLAYLRALERRAAGETEERAERLDEIEGGGVPVKRPRAARTKRLAAVSDEIDRLVEKRQTPAARQAAAKLLKATPSELGRAVVAAQTRKVAAVKSAVVSNGRVIVRFTSGLEVRFSVTISSQLASASAPALRNIDVSSFGLHWPDLDEDLSFAGLFCGTR